MKQRLAVVVGLFALTQPLSRAAAETPTEKRLRVLEEQLRKAQEDIQELKGQIEQQRAAGQATQKQAERAEVEAKTATAAQKGLEVPEWLKRTTIVGDVRARHEGFYHQPHMATQVVKGKPVRDVVTTRNRERIRARLAFKVAFSDEVSAMIRGASGDPDDPVVTNEDLKGNFSRKHFNLDWAYLTFTPGKTFGLRPGAARVSLGKFGNPIFLVSELVFDDDLSPEGAFETFHVLGEPLGPLDQVKVHALQWTFNEISNQEDGWMFGGQVNPTLHFGPAQLDAGVGQYWWLNPDQIAQALNTNKVLRNSNLVTTTKDAKGNTVVTGYLSGFNQTNTDLALTLPHVIGTQPVRLFTDFVYNWDAVNNDAYGYLGGVRLGQTKARNDWSIYAFYERLEQEAAISAFSYSDFGPGGVKLGTAAPLGTTNLEGPVVGVEYQLLNPLTLSVRSHFTTFINRPAGVTNPTLTRLLLDAVVKF